MGIGCIRISGLWLVMFIANLALMDFRTMHVPKRACGLAGRQDDRHLRMGG